MKTTDNILYRIKSQGGQTVKMLAEQLAITSMGVRQHLQSLEKEGLIEHFDQKVKVGRPTRFWQLTDKGHGRFPDCHSDLSVQLLGAVQQVFGDAGMEQLISHREQQSFSAYQQALAGHTDIADKLERLSAKRSQEGYMASWQKDQQDYYFIEDHCPICVAATECQGLCRSELEMLQKLFAECQVERTEHIVAGSRRCAYKLSLLDKA
ncbi:MULTISPECIES: helix-turn-helix transcriptional regulator [unclassified Agarivorans]|uniref:helix-turn-helix transcriptional regulator n=1 Tax=unclassified Agarivorans TaxID=2636026 RepID=UPI0026E3445E|nr:MULTISPECIES: metalloregulator ArsR/SmtB family transcription factor [unclassified Agarivorans]MDO6684324.1 transcriptional regulator [Agarivorans sp. 3_MG-2023]MDO6714489.1 transcriptional regulator [Agarivorans sp. 2_MG-2023]